MPSGRCFCNAVQYSYSGNIMKQAVCHCLDCRKISGTAFSTGIVVPGDGFKILAGKPKTISTVADSGATITSFFCGDCGTTTWRETPNFGPNKIIKAGTLDADDALDKVQPTEEFFTQHKVKWASVDLIS